MSTDQLVEGVHFNWDWCSPEDVAYKLLQMNLSDIIAKGGLPRYVLLNLQLNDFFVRNFQNIVDFSKMLGFLLKRYDIRLLGGDTTSSSNNSFGLTILGDSSHCIPRIAKKIEKGDMIVLLGEIGGSSFALDILKTSPKPSASITQYYRRPNAQWKGRFLLNQLNAKSSIDTSDSLHECLTILSEENQIECKIFVDQIASPFEVKNIDFPKQLKYLLGGGEDFAILMICPLKSKKQLDILSRYYSNLKIIGSVLSVKNKSRIEYWNKNTKIEVQPSKSSMFSHF